MPLTKVVTKCKTVGRCGTGAVKAIVLHEIRTDIESYLADARNCCDRGCQKSLHYIIDSTGCRPYQFVPEADTAWGFSWTPPSTGAFCNPCPTDPLGCNPCAVPTTDPIFTGEIGDLTLLDPNCFVIHVGVLMPVAVTESIPQTTPCGNQNLEICPTPSRLSECAYDELVKLLCDIYSHFPALPKNATTLRKFGCDLSDIDIIQLLADIQVCVPAPPPFNRLCHDLNLFPAGVPLNVFGIDAGGNCVKGPIGGGSFNLCSALALLPVGAPGVAGVSTYVGADCQVHTLPAAGSFDLCAAVAALPLGAPAILGTTVVIGDDCQRHLLPDVLPLQFTGNSGPSQLVGPGGTFKFFGTSSIQSTMAAVGVSLDLQIDPNPSNLATITPGQGLLVLPPPSTCFTYVGPAQLVHVINHGLGTLTPQLTFFDDTTNMMFIPSNVVPINANTITVTFFSPQAIRAIVSSC